MITYFKHFFPINGLLLSSMLFLLWGAKCENTPTDHGNKPTGGIYGALQIKSINHHAKYLSPTLATVYIEGTELFTKPDSLRIFYFPEVKPGKYTLIGKAPGFADYFVEEVEVHDDSLSIVEMFSLRKQSFPEKRAWDGIKIKKVDVRRKGNMAGRVYDSNTGEHVAGAYIIVKGTFWGTVTDSSGNFRMNAILAGKYAAFSGFGAYHRTVIYSIRIAPDSTSLVDFGLWPVPIPEEHLPREWEEKFIKQP